LQPQTSVVVIIIALLLLLFFTLGQAPNVMDKIQFQQYSSLQSTEEEKSWWPVPAFLYSYNHLGQGYTKQ